MILIVDMNWTMDSLAYNEFVAPIVAVIEPLEQCEVRHFSELSRVNFGSYSKVILSGATLKDFATLKQLDKFSWVKTLDKPILGICAGIETIAMVFGVPLSGCLEVGMIEITKTAASPLFEGNFKAYALHSLTVEPSQTFTVLAKSEQCAEAIKHIDKPIYGVLFHPEVRNPEILQRFLELK
jgi:GMP synthase-like glutamine amidotransferase